ncbi:hypothetical protein BC830DRAFT_867595 [Chytriomyces sp. MP71]|nr:hypothetical protein BC830DRAFT_867595 [Chytriomyces sp. MP71]
MESESKKRRTWGGTAHFVSDDESELSGFEGDQQRMLAFPAASLSGGCDGTRRRIVRACDPCRRKRVKCSGSNPGNPCEKCTAKPHLCIYTPYSASEVAALKQETAPISSKKRFELIEHRLAALEAALTTGQSQQLDSSSAEPIDHQPKIETGSPKQGLKHHHQQLSLNPAVTFSSASILLPVSRVQEPSIPLVPPPTPSMDGASQTKAGGFVIKADDTLLFFGSTSSLGGPKDDSNPWKSQPRFQNGILQAYNANLKQDQAHTPPSEESGAVPKCSKCAGEGIIKSVRLFDLVPLPDHLLDHILKIFWEQMHPQFPLIERSYFDDKLQTIRSLEHFHIDGHWQFCLLLLSVVALMINGTPSLNCWGKTAGKCEQTAFKEHAVVLKHVMDHYRRIMLDHFGVPDLILIQSLVFMVMTVATGIASRLSQGSWSYMGIAVRLSQELGLHRSIKSLGVRHRLFTPEFMALRNRTWHCVMILETYTGIWTGRPLGIHDSDWDAEYPEVTNPEIATLKHHIDLSLIIASILRFANRARKADEKVFAHEIELRLAGWWNGLDSDWRALEFGERWNAKAVMALMWNATVILFHRTAYNRIDHPACLESASAITRIVSRLESPAADNEATVLFPNFIYCTIMGITVHIQQIFTCERGSPDETNRALFETAVTELESCMRLLDVMRRDYASAERSWKTICDFLGSKGLRLEELFKSVKKSRADRAKGLSKSCQRVNAETPSISSDVFSQASSIANEFSPHSWAPSSFSNSSLFGGGAGGSIGFGSGLGFNDLSLWDGLSFFDLAGLGSLANTDFLLLGQPPLSQAPPYQQQQQHQQEMVTQQTSQITPSFHQFTTAPLVKAGAAVAAPLSGLHQLADISIGNGSVVPNGAAVFSHPPLQQHMS